MTTILSLLDTSPWIFIPFQILEWVGLFLLAGLVGWGIYKLRKETAPHNSRYWLVLVLLAILTPVTASLIGFQLPAETASPLPNLPVEPSALIIMVFSALPWVLAAGWLGVIPAVGLAAITGLFFAFWQTHSLFTIFETILLALIFSAAIWQNYRTRFYRLIRHPLGAALLASMIMLPVYTITAFFAVNGTLAVRLDYALTQTWPAMLVHGAELMLAGLIAEIVQLNRRHERWGYEGPLQPSPAESSLQTRFTSAILPVILVVLFILIVVDWNVAGQSAKVMLRDQLANTAQVAADSMPYFLESGQSLIQTLAQQTLIQATAEQSRAQLQQNLRSTPYFRLLYLFDSTGQPVTGYPQDQLSAVHMTQDEQVAIGLALKGVLIQTYTIPPVPGEKTAQVAFIASIVDGAGQITGVLLGRTDLNSNPFTLPAIQALEKMTLLNGSGILIDEGNRILYHTNPAQVMSTYAGKTFPQSNFSEELSSQGTRNYVYFQPVVGRSWSIILSVPAQNVQEIALQIAFPLLIILVLVAALAYAGLRFNMRRLTASIKDLAVQAESIARGQLANPIRAAGEDEVGQLGQSFEQMRLSLKARLDELNRLLVVSQGVAANLEIEHSVQPILAAAKIEPAYLVRIALIQEVTLEPDLDKLVAFGVGSGSDSCAYLDPQVFELLRTQDVLSIPNTARVRRLNIPLNAARPGALLAVAIRYENAYYGALWVAFEGPRNFTEEEVRFLSVLAGEAALAAANARLYASAEIGRQRLEAVLVSTPEPVLVIDEKNRLLLLNPAAMQVPGLVGTAVTGRPIQDVISSTELLSFMQMPLAQGISSREISLPNGKIYFCSMSEVKAEGRSVGKVCLLRDITHYKELDRMKSEFVSTVSHDLRSPLTLMRGYASMLQMIGQLNDQQQQYVAKIITGVETMARLVNNLLDLGRIEAGIDLQAEKVSPVGVIDQVLSGLQAQANQKNITLTKQVPEGGIADIDADSALLQQAVYNLVDNAIKYTPVGGKVNIRLEQREGNVVFEVSDTGIGVAPLDLPRVFEKFYRSGRREAYSQRGSGLGLAIVKSIVERHGGKVWVESQLGKGSRFFILIPLQRAAKPVPAGKE